jgi:hypothetical protein
MCGGVDSRSSFLLGDGAPCAENQRSRLEVLAELVEVKPQFFIAVLGLEKHADFILVTPVLELGRQQLARELSSNRPVVLKVSLKLDLESAG